MIRWKMTTAVAVAAVLALSGCTASSQNASAGDSTLTLGLIVPATTFSAQDMNWSNESPYAQAVYDGLVRADPDGKIVPWLATEWSFDDAKTKLTMKLREDVTFTDGTKFDASVAAENVTRFRDGNSPYKALLALVSKAEAVDSSTLEIDLTAPDPALLTSLSQAAGLQESPKAFDSPTIQTVPVGSGPYKLDTSRTVVGSSYAFTKNADYWAPESVHYDNLVLNVYNDGTGTALLNAVKGGQVNASTTADNASLKQMEAAGFTVNPLELNWIGLVLFDRGGQSDPALGDVRVRQAINYAFDTKALLKAMGEGYGTATTQVFPPNSPGFEESLDSRYEYNPEKARQLIKEAGYADGLTLSQPSQAGDSALYALISQQLEAIGITVNYTDTGNNFIADVLAPKFGSIFMVLQQDPTAWQIANFSLLPNAPWNPYHYEDPTVVSLVKKIQVGTTEEADSATKELNAHIVEQAWFAPWFRMQSSFVTDAQTSVKVQQGTAYPYLWNFTPKS